jgi:putative ABC transport system permease protein
VLPGALQGWHVLAALAGCTAVGLLFGLGPAWAAATADPVEAIRHE